MENQFRYAALIAKALAEMIEEEDLKEELFEQVENDNLTEFIHAMATVAPTTLFAGFTGQNVDQLEFNHIANRLIHQFSNNKNSENGASIGDKEE